MHEFSKRARSKFFNSKKKARLMVTEKMTAVYLANGEVKMILRVLSSLAMAIYRCAGSKMMATLVPSFVQGII